MHTHNFTKLPFKIPKILEIWGPALTSFSQLGCSDLFYIKYNTWAFRKFPAILEICNQLGVMGLGKPYIS